MPEQLHAELAHTQQVLDDVNRKNAEQFLDGEQNKVRLEPEKRYLLRWGGNHYQKIRNKMHGEGEESVADD